MTTYLVGYNGPVTQGQGKFPSLQAVTWSTLQPGDTLLVYPGQYGGVTTVMNCHGTSTSPITITAVVSTTLPQLLDSLDIQQSSWLVFNYLSFEKTTYTGVIVRNGSASINVSHCTIDQCPAGMQISTDAGTGNLFSYNTITNCATYGIGLDRVAGSASGVNKISFNTITGCGQHGIEAQANYTLIKKNKISQCGKSIGGTSAIHVYSNSSTAGYGQNNTIEYNYCWRQADTSVSDGNGIEIDQWCNNNTVLYNVCWENDGAGIIVYDAANNVVRNNTCYGNGLDPNKTHGGLGEVIVNGTSSANVKNNTVSNNILISTAATVPAMYIDTRAVAGGQHFGVNIYDTPAGGTLLRWTDSNYYTNLSDVIKVTGGVGSTVETPIFEERGTPDTDGLQLSDPTVAVGTAPAAVEYDMLGIASTSAIGWVGAYYYTGQSVPPSTFPFVYSH